MPRLLLLILTTLLVSFYSFSQGDNPTVFQGLKASYINSSTLILTDPNSPQGTGVRAFFISLIKKSDSKPRLKIHLQYAGSSRLGVYGYKIIVDKNLEYLITPNDEDISRSNPSNYDYRSWTELFVSETLLNVLREVAKSENPKLKYFGTYGELERKIDKREREAVARILDAYDFLNKD